MSGRGNVLVRTAGFFMIPAGFVCFFMSIVYGLLDLYKLADEGGSLGFEILTVFIGILCAVSLIAYGKAAWRYWKSSEKAEDMMWMAALMAAEIILYRILRTAHGAGAAYWVRGIFLYIVAAIFLTGAFFSWKKDEKTEEQKSTSDKKKVNVRKYPVTITLCLMAASGLITWGCYFWSTLNIFR